MSSKRSLRHGSHMTTVTVSPRFQIVIPQVIRASMGIRPGHRIHALQYQDRIELIPVRPMIKARGILKGEDVNNIKSIAARSTPDSSYVPRTELGRRLLELRGNGIRSGMKLLTASDINEEVTRRRGESCDR